MHLPRLDVKGDGTKDAHFATTWSFTFDRGGYLCPLLTQMNVDSMQLSCFGTSFVFIEPIHENLMSLFE